MTEDALGEVLRGLKSLSITVRPSYAVISAWEYDNLQGEAIVREYTRHASIYLLLQRPMVYFQNVRTEVGAVTFEIVDGVQAPLTCRVDLVEAGLCAPGEGVDIETHFLKDLADQTEPYNDVGAIKVRRADGELVVWWSPEKFLWEVVNLGFPATVEGDVAPYFEYQVHYIGKAFSQSVWNRLNGHKNFQSILIREGSLAGGYSRPAFEISVLMLQIDGVQDHLQIDPSDDQIVPGLDPIFHEFGLENDDARRVAFFTPGALLDGPEVTAEVEARLISRFRPEYNTVKFENYPKIAGGTRAVGYSCSEIILDIFPIGLRTDEFEFLSTEP